MKRNTIIKLSEEKEMINMAQIPNNKNMNEIYVLRMQLHQQLTEKENI